MRKERGGLVRHWLQTFTGVACVLALCLVCARGLHAQEAGTILGTVTDQSGGVIPDATVTATNQNTGAVARTVTTNSAGNYLMAGLPVSTYTVKVSKQGFKTATHSDLMLNVRSDVRVDFTLSVGQVSVEVNVVASSVHLQTENAAVSDTITAHHVDSIELNGRNFVQLATLVPGAAGQSLVGSLNAPVGVTANTNINFNGLRQNHNVWSVDGQENYDRGCGGCIEIVPDQDAIQEFKVLSSNASQDLGFGSGAHIQMEIKSGTSRYHGEVFEFNRNRRLEATPWVLNAAGRKPDGTPKQPRPKDNYNNFGFNLGGPIGKPGGEPKTFFFTTIDWRRLVQGQTFSGNGTPVPWTTGDFSASSVGSSGISSPVILDHSKPDPSCTGCFFPFPNNVIPGAQQDPNALILGKSGFLFLPPNSGKNAVGGFSGPINVNEQIVRIDHQFSEKTSLMAHYIRDGIVQVVPRGLWQTSTFPVVATDFLNEPESILLKLTHTISPTLLSETMVGFNRQPLTLLDLGTFAKPAGLTTQELFAENPDNRIPTINIGSPQSVNYTAASWPWTNVLNTWTFREALTKIAGNHTLNFGIEDLHYLKQQKLFGLTQGSYNFDGSATKGSYMDPATGTVKTTNGNAFADFILGFAQNYSEELTQGTPAWINNHVGLWIGDNWKVRNGLTLNLGLRWEGMPHAHERHNQGANFYPKLFDFALASTVLDSSGHLPAFNNTTNPYLNGIGIAGKNAPTGFVQNHWALFQPRVGFAWQPHPGGKMVVRGGVGMFYENIQGNDVYNMGPNPPFSSTPQIFNTTLTNPGGGSAVASPGNLQGLDFLYSQPSSYQWNFGGEYQFTSRTIFSLSYVGNKSTHQAINANINQPLPSATPYPSPGINAARPYLGWGRINMYTNSSNANYNSLQASLRFSDWHGLTSGVAYTWSHCIDYVDNDNPPGNAFNLYDFARERGHCGFDFRHILVMNYSYALPFFNQSPGFKRTMLGGWQVSGITTFYSGIPLTIGTIGGDLANCDCGGYRADVTGDPNSGSGIGTAAKFFNTSVFAKPAAGTFGTSARNVVRGAGIANFDTSVFKNFAGIPLPHSKEGGTLQLRFEFFNIVNHAEFNSFATTFGNSNFGQALNTRLPRQIQLGAKFTF